MDFGLTMSQITINHSRFVYFGLSTYLNSQIIITRYLWTLDQLFYSYIWCIITLRDIFLVLEIAINTT
jgi:hypothetical protein